MLRVDLRRRPKCTEGKLVMSDATQGTKIVVGLDFSEAGDRAFTHAVRWVRNDPQGELHVVHVVTSDDFQRAEGSAKLEKQDFLLRDLPPKIWEHIRKMGSSVNSLHDESPVSLHIRFGEAAATIHQVAIDYDADLIVVGTHGRRGLERLVLGSVAESLVKIAHCPVLVARPKNYAGLEKSERIDPPRKTPSLDAGERKWRVPGTGYSHTQVMRWTSQPPTGLRIV